MRQKIIFILISVLILSLAFPLSVSAEGGITKIDEFERLDTGDGQFIKYSRNYHLDRIDPGIFDKWQNNFADATSNFFFGVFKEFSYITMVMFYHCFAFDIADMFGNQLSSIQAALRRLFFDGAFFLIVFASSAFYIVKQLLKANLQNLLTEILKVVAIVIISQAVVTESVPFLSFVNTFTKQISVEALGGISGDNLSTNDGNASLRRYAAEAAGVLWSGLVHKPWESLEFGEDYSGAAGHTENILSLSRSSDSRKNLVESLNNSEGLFGEDVGWDRLFPAFIMAAPILIKCIFYFIIALLQLGFQIITLFYVILCPLILLLAISPQLGGMDLIWSWLKKIAETQMSVLILTFIIGLVVRFDALLADWNSAGWLIGLWLQVIAMAVLVWNWQKVLKFMSSATRSIQNPHLATRKLQYSGNMYEGMSHALPPVVHGAQQLGGMAIDAGLAVSDTLKTNYNNVPQYEPQEKAKIQPKKLNTEVLKNHIASKAASNADIAGANNKIVDFSKIPRYEKNTSKAEPVQRPTSYKVAANGEDLVSTNKNTSIDAQRLYTVNYGTRAANYVTTKESPPKALQGPSAAGYKPSAVKSAASAQTTNANEAKPTNENAMPRNTRPPIPKPVVKDFEFKPQRSVSDARPKTKPIAKQFDFKVYTPK